MTNIVDFPQVGFRLREPVWFTPDDPAEMIGVLTVAATWWLTADDARATEPQIIVGRGRPIPIRDVTKMILGSEVALLPTVVALYQVFGAADLADLPHTCGEAAAFLLSTILDSRE